MHCQRRYYQASCAIPKWANWQHTDLFIFRFYLYSHYIYFPIYRSDWTRKSTVLLIDFLIDNFDWLYFDSIYLWEKEIKTDYHWVICFYLQRSCLIKVESEALVSANDFRPVFTKSPYLGKGIFLQISFVNNFSSNDRRMDDPWGLSDPWPLIFRDG